MTRWPPILVLVLILALAAGCGPRAASPRVSNTGASTATVEDWDGDAHLADGEMLVEPMVEGFENPHRWQPAGGPQIGLVVVMAADGGADVDRATVRAIVGRRPVDLGDFTFNQAYGINAAWIERPGGRLLFSGGDSGGSGDPGSVQLYLVGWDAAAGEVRVVDRWSGTGIDDVPAWAAR